MKITIFLRCRVDFTRSANGVLFLVLSRTTKFSSSSIASFVGNGSCSAIVSRLASAGGAGPHTPKISDRRDARLPFANVPNVPTEPSDATEAFLS